MVAARNRHEGNAMKIRMPREKLEAIEKARSDLRRARREVSDATDRLRAAERDAADSAFIDASVQPSGRR